MARTSTSPTLRQARARARSLSDEKLRRAVAGLAYGAWAPWRLAVVEEVARRDLDLADTGEEVDR